MTGLIKIVASNFVSKNKVKSYLEFLTLIFLMASILGDYKTVASFECSNHWGCCFYARTLTRAAFLVYKSTLLFCWKYSSLWYHVLSCQVLEKTVNDNETGADKRIKVLLFGNNLPMSLFTAMTRKINVDTKIDVVGNIISEVAVFTRRIYHLILIKWNKGY